MKNPHQKKYEELSEQYGVPVGIVKSNDEQVRLQFLGTFSVPKGRRQKIDEKKLLAKKMRDEKKIRQEK